MLSNEFPHKISRTLGQFWLPQSPENAVTGVVEVSGSDIRLEVSPGLTPMHSYTQLGPGRWGVGSTADPAEMVVLGTIPMQPRLLSVWDAATTRRRMIGLPSPVRGDKGPSSHELAATWLLAGEHFPDLNRAILGIRPDVTNLSEWAWIPSLATTIYPDDRLRLDWHLNVGNKSLDCRLPDNAGFLTLGPAATHKPPDIRGFTVKTYSQLEIELFEGWTMPEVFHRALNPLVDLLTLLSGSSCELRALDVWAGNNWCSVHGHQIHPKSPETTGDLLFTQPQVGLEFLARWFEIYRRTTPVPQILAAVVRNEFPTVEAEALSLATAIEALHRGLFPEARRFSADEIDQSVQAIATSDMPFAVASTLSSALGQYWHEHSYPQRVEALVEPVARAVPACIGKVSRWKNAVVNQRVSLAHGLAARASQGEEEILGMYAMNRSIHWMLVLRLLLLAGVSPSLLASSTSQSERFDNDSGRWHRHWPKVYGTS